MLNLSPLPPRAVCFRIQARATAPSCFKSHITTEQISQTNPGGSHLMILQVFSSLVDSTIISVVCIQYGFSRQGCTILHPEWQLLKTSPLKFKCYETKDSLLYLCQNLFWLCASMYTEGFHIYYYVFYTVTTWKKNINQFYVLGKELWLLLLCSLHVSVTCNNHVSTLSY